MIIPRKKSMSMGIGIRLVLLFIASATLGSCVGIGCIVGGTIGYVIDGIRSGILGLLIGGIIGMCSISVLIEWPIQEAFNLRKAWNTVWQRARQGRPLL